MMDHETELEQQEAKEYVAKLETVANELFESYKNSIYLYAYAELVESNGFIARQAEVWGEVFATLDAMYSISLQSAEIYGEELVDFVSDPIHKIYCDERQFRFDALRHIHGRALQIMLEIICLLKGGFADGALARWRTMFELNVIAQFIYNDTEDVAKAYYEASESNRFDWAKVSNIFETKREKGHINFGEIFQNCAYTNKKEVWDAEYSFASKLVHAYPCSTKGRLSNTINQEAIPAGRSQIGVNVAAEHAAITLDRITSLFLTLIGTNYSRVAACASNKWVDIVQQAIGNVKKTLGDEFH